MEQYWTAHLIGKRLGERSYSFPSEMAACKFAEAHVQMPGTDEAWVEGPKGGVVKDFPPVSKKKTIDWVPTGNTGHGKTPYTAKYS